MRIIQKEHTCTQSQPWILQLLDENCIFLDIETTGLSSKKNQIYLIGYAKRFNHTLYVTQYFCESLLDEALILQKFSKDMEEIDTIITFNGASFDVPFIKERCCIHGIPEDIFQKKHYDLYRLISRYKSIFQLENYKQKSIEVFLGLNREDKFSGAELIDVYFDYLATRSMEEFHLLQLHNYEDVISMQDLLPILSYLKLFEGEFTVKECNCNSYLSYEGQTCEEIFLTLIYDYQIPQSISYNYQDIYLRIEQNETTIRIPIVAKEMCHFFADYKNYYYLPAEDQAIHKSVSQYVDASHRIQARASNCYTKKTAKFLPQYDNLFSPVFQESLKSKIHYFEYTNTFITNYDDLNTYAKHIISFITKKTDHI